MGLVTNIMTDGYTPFALPPPPGSIIHIMPLLGRELEYNGDTDRQALLKRGRSSQ